MATLPALLLSLLLLLCPAAPALAFGLSDLPASPPSDAVLDQSGVLSRATAGEINRRLQAFASDRIDARLVTVDHLDYGLDLETLAGQLRQRWAESQPAGSPPLLLMAIDTQNTAVSLVADPALAGQLPADLLSSTARATVTPLLRDGGRYRQGVLGGLERLAAVLQGGEDPGEPIQPEAVAIPTNVPSQEETASSNALTWVVVLLVVGSIVPMLTWWVFSR
ncbi:MAG: TPM domain-containing protein [Cyanobacteriota bacterium]|nr:TPM domain-containing protein [Cyanobacteriota bacterium]